MTAPLTINLENQFGEKSVNSIIGGTAPDVSTPIAGDSILANLTGGTAVPAAASYADVALKLPARMVLNDFDIDEGGSPVSNTDNVTQAFDKLAYNCQNVRVLDNILSGLATDDDSVVTSADTILEAIGKLQAQISAL